ncbi:peptidoglycan DD-metalloendopeptidase family protein [Microbacterium sp. CnD16-F]|nr:M23 family metallopeptidase [Microbacterium sp. CnD16-F]MCO7204637.1 peptidoglycan DD-metalloendopeptidase family protein [Microbacterium sp. CnD16-F]
MRRRNAEEPLRVPDVDCGCAPTADELRSLRTISRRGVVGLAAIGVVVGSVGLGIALPAFAAKYPTWDDVEKARTNQAAKNAEITRIEGLIRALENDVNVKQAEAERLGQEYLLALEAFEDAVDRAQSLQDQADAETSRAREAAAKLGDLAALQYRNGKSDPTLELFFSGSVADADDLLARLGAVDKLVDANRDVYADAVGARDSAQSLTDQAKVARDERDRLKLQAEQRMDAARQAAQTAQAALIAQNEHRLTLEAQLSALQDTTTKTIAGYRAGVEAERKRREEAQRKAREEAAQRAREDERRRLAEEERRRQQAAAGGGSRPGRPSDGSSAGGRPASSGWVRPAHGGVTSPFGSRGTICSNGYCTSSGHRGLDFSAGCGAPLYAAAAGTVIFAGWSGSWGNYVKIQHRDGSVTAYAHILNGGYNVSYGQTVRAGQVIAYAGTTGASTGCHLHFEVYIGGVRVDPAAFLRARGVGL